MHLMIENVGIADMETFTLLGVSTTRYDNAVERIGMFGSGFKNALCVFLRQNINPIVFISNLRLEFFTETKNIRGVGNEQRDYHQVCVKLSGKDNDGNQIKRTEKLGFTTEFGEIDWNHINMALREVVSNAIDASYKICNSMKGMTMTVMDDNQVRAKKNHTRFFVPLTQEVLNFLNARETLFLQFKVGDAAYTSCIMEKGDIEHAMIYKRGVFVSKIPKPSIFDYNCYDMKLDESRNLDVYNARSYAAHLLSTATLSQAVHFLKNLTDDKWEASFSYYDLNIEHNDNRETWEKAWKMVHGENAVACSSKEDESYINKLLVDRGKKPVYMPEGFLDSFAKANMPTETTVLSADDRKYQYNFMPASKAVHNAVEHIWSQLESMNLTLNKEMPTVQCFSEIMSDSKSKLGFYKFGTNEIYINADLMESPTFMLYQTVLEEISHYVSGASDCTRDFQDFAFRVAAKTITTFEETQFENFNTNPVEKKP